MLLGEIFSACWKAASASLLSPLLASAIPCSVHNCASFGDFRKAERLNCTALSNSLARNAEVIGSIWLSWVWEKAKGRKISRTTERPSFFNSIMTITSAVAGSVLAQGTLPGKTITAYV